MYLSKIFIKNVGPIRFISREFEKPDLNNAKNIMTFIGANGSGKSILLSYIADALFEVGKSVFEDISSKSFEFQNPYFRISGGINVTYSENHSIVYLEFANDTETVCYIEKIGNLSVAQVENELGFSLQNELKWNTSQDSENIKKTMFDKNKVKDMYLNNSLCYFPPARYEAPLWMNKKSIDQIKYSLETKFSNRLYRPLFIQNDLDKNIEWLIDVIVDSRADLLVTSSGLSVDGNVNDIKLLKVSKTNFESILSIIMGKQVKFKLLYRRETSQRLQILDAQTNQVLAKSINSLSSGQLALLNIFATIIRYSDSFDLNRSIRLRDIEGIVVVDEVDLHIHSKLLYEKLPELVSMFPKVQFLFSAHSPMLLLALSELDKADVLKLPNLESVIIREFEEVDFVFRKVLENFDIDSTVPTTSIDNKPLILTEGKTDIKHLKNALKHFQEKDEFLEIDLNFYETKDLGVDVLYNMCESHSRTPKDYKMIFISDRDIPKYTTKFSSNEAAQYKSWGNNVYSFALPTPSNRNSVDLISIEHYYTNETIKTNFDFDGGIRRRMFLGNEFNNKGIHITDDLVCKAINKITKNPLSILDGSGDTKVTRLRDDINIALTKNDFADKISAVDIELIETDLENFRILFEIISSIINES